MDGITGWPTGATIPQQNPNTVSFGSLQQDVANGGLTVNQQAPQVLGANSYNGGLYYNPTTGQLEQSNNGTWSNLDTSGFGASNTGPSATEIARNNRQTGIGSIYTSANDAATNMQSKFGNSVLDNTRALQQGQDAINLKAQNNEASRTQGINGVLGMVGRGIQSGGRYLGNRNAGSSSAAGEIARAYGDIGRRQMSSVGNQYEQNNSQILQDQGNQDYNVGKTKREFNQSLNDTVNTIVESARTQLADLDTQGANASLPDRIAIEQEKQNIKNQVMAKLQQYDTQMATNADSIKARDRQGNMVAANQQLDAGQAPANSFNYTDQTPGQFQNTGPFSSGLPIFTNPNRRQIA